MIVENNIDSTNIIDEDQPPEVEIDQTVRRTTRETKLPSYHNEFSMNLHATTINTEEYKPEVATVIA